MNFLSNLFVFVSWITKITSLIKKRLLLCSSFASLNFFPPFGIIPNFYSSGKALSTEAGLDLLNQMQLNELLFMSAIQLGRFPQFVKGMCKVRMPYKDFLQSCEHCVQRILLRRQSICRWCSFFRGRYNRFEDTIDTMDLLMIGYYAQTDNWVNIHDEIERFLVSMYICGPQFGLALA